MKSTLNRYYNLKHNKKEWQGKGFYIFHINSVITNIFLEVKKN